MVWTAVLITVGGGRACDIPLDGRYRVRKASVSRKFRRAGSYSRSWQVRAEVDGRSRCRSIFSRWSGQRVRLCVIGCEDGVGMLWQRRGKGKLIRMPGLGRGALIL